MDGNYGQNQNWQDQSQNQPDQNWQDQSQNQPDQNWQDQSQNQSNQNWQNPNQNNYYNGYYNGQPGIGYPNVGSNNPNIPNQGYAGYNGYNNYAPNSYNGPIVVANAVPPKSGGLAVGSLVCGIITLICFWSMITVIAAIVGIVLGAVNNAQGNPNKGMAIAGIILNVLSIFFTIAFIVIITTL